MLYMYYIYIYIHYIYMYTLFRQKSIKEPYKYSLTFQKPLLVSFAVYTSGFKKEIFKFPPSDFCTHVNVLQVLLKKILVVNTYINKHTYILYIYYIHIYIYIYVQHVNIILCYTNRMPRIYTNIYCQNCGYCK